MKKTVTTLLSLICIVFSVQTIKAEENARFPKNLFVEFGLGYISFAEVFENGSEIKNLTLTPTIGYRFLPRWSAGFGVSFLTGKERIYKPMPSLFVAYDFLKNKTFSSFVQLQGTYGKNPHIGWLDTLDASDGDSRSSRFYNNYVQRDLWECGFRLGASCNFSDHFSANIRYLFIGYSNRSYVDDYRGGVLGDKDYIIDAGLRSLQLSLRYTF